MATQRGPGLPVKSGEASAAGRQKRVGRRAGSPDTRGQILGAARHRFANGYSAATLRGIANDAGVDVSQVVQFFGGKEDLFIAAMADAIKPAVALEAVLAGGGRGTGLRLARFFLGLWEQPATRDSMQGMLLSATTHPDLLRSFVVEQLLGRVSQVARQDAPQRRAALVGSQLVGLAVARYMVGVPSLADCPMETAARSIAATLDRYLRGPLPADR